MKIFPKITWRQPGGLTECPYFHRTIIDFGLFSIRIHEWHGDDDHRAFHDHPYWFWTFVLKGGYTDVAPFYSPVVKDDEGRRSHKEYRDTLGFGSIRYRSAKFKHSVQNVIPGTITLLITGKPSRRWGFWVDGKLIKRDKYFATMGHHPCDPVNDYPVRFRPNKERIQE